MKLWDIFLDALYPENVTCPGCGRNRRLDRHGLCGKCRTDVEPCGMEQGMGELDGIVSGIWYDKTAREMMHRFKYEGAEYLGKSLSGYICLPAEWRDAVILPVPMYSGRLRERGYNQTDILARLIGKRYHMPVRPELMKRIRDTASQTSMDKTERAQNIRGAFRASDKCRGMSILLVDDVLTTGSTSMECAKTLKDAGAARVYLAAACRTRPDRRE